MDDSATLISEALNGSQDTELCAACGSCNSTTFHGVLVSAETVHSKKVHAIHLETLKALTEPLLCRQKRAGEKTLEKRINSLVAAHFPPGEVTSQASASWQRCCARNEETGC